MILHGDYVTIVEPQTNDPEDMHYVGLFTGKCGEVINVKGATFTVQLNGVVRPALFYEYELRKVARPVKKGAKNKPTGGM